MRPQVRRRGRHCPCCPGNTPAIHRAAFALPAYAYVLDAISRITRREPEITPRAATIVSYDLAVDSGKAQRELDYAITPIDTLLDDTIAWMHEQGMLRAG